VLATQVKGARISVDGKAAEEGIFSEEMPPGKHTIKVSADGYFDEEREVMLQGSPLALDITLRERPATVAFQTSDGAQISVDGRLVGITPLPVPIEVSPGVHVISVALNGHEAFSTEVELERGESRTLQAPLRRTTQRAVSYGFIGVAGASLVAGGVFSVLALRSQSQAQQVLDNQAQRTISRQELDDYNQARKDRDDLWRPAALGSFGAALGFGLLGGFLYAFDRPVAQVSAPKERGPRQPQPVQPPVPTLDISAGPGWWGLNAKGHFLPITSSDPQGSGEGKGPKSWGSVLFRDGTGGRLPLGRGARGASMEFRAVYEQHYDFVWRSLRRLGVRDADVPDALQEVFLVVLRRLGEFEGRARLTTWLFRICMRVARDRQRLAHNRRELLDAQAVEGCLDEGSDLGQQAERREDVKLLELALSRMDLDQRAVFTLFELEEQSGEEIAETLQIPLGTVYSRLRLGREAFRKVFQRAQAQSMSVAVRGTP
jgi:RNA polymerase sigma-70 factor (ECF subfamily)